jgi:ParB/RepB/Spo0J family partition protein
MLEMIPLGRLGLSPDNPRRMGAGDLTGLKASICADGVLQNLVVYPVPDQGAGDPSYYVAAGGRRFRAMQELYGEGKLALDYLVPCRIEESFDRAKAVAENVVREPMHPVDEFEAFNAIAIEHGIEAVMNRFGVSDRYVRQRMKIADLTKGVRKALKAGEISMAEAFAIALHKKSDHTRLVNMCIEAKDDQAGRLRRMAFEQKIPEERALFDVALYDGKWEHDLFPEPGTSGRYFADKKKFLDLQMVALIKKGEEMAREEGYGGARFVNVGEEHGLEMANYNAKGKHLVILFGVNPQTGEMQRRGNPYYDEEKTAQLAADRAKREHEIKLNNKEVGKTIKAERMERWAIDARYSQEMRNGIATHRMSALQLAVSENTLVALRWVVFCLLLEVPEVKIEVKQYLGLSAPACCTRELNTLRQKLRKALRLDVKGDDVKLWLRLKQLDQDELLQALAMLVAPSVGFHGNDYADEKRVEELMGQELEVEVEKYWRPDEEFLAKMNREQLREMVEETLGDQAAKFLMAGKKSDAVAALAKLHKDPMKMQQHQIGFAGKNLVDEERRQAFACWLPKGMGFYERTESEIVKAGKPKVVEPADDGELVAGEVIAGEEDEDRWLPADEAGELVADVPETGDAYPVAAE